MKKTCTTAVVAERTFRTAVFALLALFAAVLGGCLMEDREVEIVLGDEHCEQFTEYHTTGSYTTPGLLEFSEALDRLLADNELEKAQIVDAFLVSGSFEVLEFAHVHDWVLSGIITVERTDIIDDPDTLVIYTEMSVEGALGVKTRVTLHPAGVAAVDQALDDYLAGGYPSLLLAVISGGVVPPPSVADPLSFRWESCLDLQVIYTLETTIPNPFGG